MSKEAEQVQESATNPTIRRTGAVNEGGPAKRRSTLRRGRSANDMQGKRAAAKLQTQQNSPGAGVTKGAAGSNPDSAPKQPVRRAPPRRKSANGAELGAMRRVAGKAAPAAAAEAPPQMGELFNDVMSVNEAQGELMNIMKQFSMPTPPAAVSTPSPSESKESTNVKATEGNQTGKSEPKAEGKQCIVVKKLEATPVEGINNKRTGGNMGSAAGANQAQDVLGDIVHQISTPKPLSAVPSSDFKPPKKAEADPKPKGKQTIDEMITKDKGAKSEGGGQEKMGNLFDDVVSVNEAQNELMNIMKQFSMPPMPAPPPTASQSDSEAVPKPLSAAPQSDSEAGKKVVKKEIAKAGNAGKVAAAKQPGGRAPPRRNKSANGAEMGAMRQAPKPAPARPPAPAPAPAPAAGTQEMGNLFDDVMSVNSAQSELMNIMKQFSMPMPPSPAAPPPPANNAGSTNKNSGKVVQTKKTKANPLNNSLSSACSLEDPGALTDTGAEGTRRGAGKARPVGANTPMKKRISRMSASVSSTSGYNTDGGGDDKNNRANRRQSLKRPTNQGPPVQPLQGQDSQRSVCTEPNSNSSNNSLVKGGSAKAGIENAKGPASVKSDVEQSKSNNSGVSVTPAPAKEAKEEDKQEDPTSKATKEAKEEDKQEDPISKAEDKERKTINKESTTESPTESKDKAPETSISEALESERIKKNSSFSSIPNAIQKPTRDEPKKKPKGFWGKVVGFFSVDEPEDEDAPPDVFCEVCGIDAEFATSSMVKCPHCFKTVYCSHECLNWDCRHGNHEKICDKLHAKSGRDDDVMTRALAFQSMANNDACGGSSIEAIRQMFKNQHRQESVVGDQLLDNHSYRVPQ